MSWRDKTLASEKRRAAIRNVGLIIIDEAHHATRANTYGKILHYFGALSCRPSGNTDPSWTCDTCDGNPGDVKVAGFTATLARGDKQKLSEVWGVEQPFTRDIIFGIRRGYLLDVRGERIIVPDFNMSNVRQTAGDYRDSDLGEEMERTFAPEVVAREYAARAGHRKGIAFWPLVAVAEHGAKAFNDAGIRSEVIHGELPKLERRAVLRRLHTGETQVVHGVGVLTEGFDAPTCDVVVVARPTRSAPLYQQMVGRVLRPDLTIPAAQREKALILDVAGAGAEHDLRQLVDLAPERALKRDHPEDASLLELDTELQEWETEVAELEALGDAMTADFAEDYSGETAVMEFDPLGRDKAWGRTDDGAWFISAGGVGYVFVVESVAGDPGNWDVITCSKLGYRRDGVDPWAKATEYVDIPMDLALAEAEVLAVEMGGFGAKSLTSKKSRWRLDEPSDAQKAWAARAGIKYEGMTKGELTDVRNRLDATRRIDPLIRTVREMSESS